MMYLVFYLKKNSMAQRHAPFDKKNVAPMCPFSFLQTIRKITWSKGYNVNSSELSNFDAIVKI
jgi:hypothetical protein